MRNNLTKSVRVSRGLASSAGAAGQTTLTGATLDMAGFQSATALVPLGTIAATGVLTLKWRAATLPDLSDAVDLEGTLQTFGPADSDKVVFSEITPIPAHRFVFVVVSRQTANSTVGGLLYAQHGARVYPVAHGANVTGELHVDPVGGLA